ncbi:MAG: hypothetical protein AVDCRST_MAG75-688, partial [uncultured Propionibacteriaceae bacterium]
EVAVDADTAGTACLGHHERRLCLSRSAAVLAARRERLGGAGGDRHPRHGADPLATRLPDPSDHRRRLAAL